MTHPQSDIRANNQDNIDHCVTAIGRSPERLSVFICLHKSRQTIKTVKQIALECSLTRKRALKLTKDLKDDLIINPTTRDGDLAYEREGFYYKHRSQIISLVKSPNKRKKLATKYRHPAITQITVSAPRSMLRTATITIDDVDSFAKVRRIKKKAGDLMPMRESQFKLGVQSILAEHGKFKDWGGEYSDLFTTRLQFKNSRVAAAFAFKGRGRSGPLTPGKMGKNGDQIPRLFQEDAEIFFVQHHTQITSSVVQQMATYAQNKALATGKKIYYGIIDGSDSARLVSAYPKAFKGKKKV